MKKILLKFIPFGFTYLFCDCSQSDNSKQKTDPIYGEIADSAMVASAHPIASQVGITILKKGGNAIDAAVATQFALAVVYPNAGNIGGGGFMVLRMNNGEINSLDFRETAPMKASRDMYLDENGNVIKGKSSFGILSVGVPGSVDGMIRAHQKYGYLPWKVLVQPAIDLAEKGFPITKLQADELNKLKEEFLKWNDTSYPIPLVKENWKAGDTLVQKDLARTLTLIRDNGRDGFYSGPTADNIITLMQNRGGIISYDDLNKYKSVWRKPVIGWYKNYKIISMPPPSSGGIALMQLLKMIEPYNVKNMQWNKKEYVHLLVEAEKRVYADRSIHIGDPDFYPVPVIQLLDSHYIVSRMNDFNSEKRTDCKLISAGVFEKITESEQTTHFSIVDKWRNAVSVTTTINSAYGSYIFVPGSGFLLNNEMDDFSVKPGTPNMYGLIGAEANAITPGKRMLSSMTPTILEKNGKLFMVLGTPGGSTIITTVFQTILNVTEHNMTMQEAVNARRFHHQWKPDTIFIEENALDSLTVKELQKKEHNILKRSLIGRTDAILVLPNNRLEGGADPRGDDKAMGY